MEMVKFACQQQCVSLLQEFAKKDKHSVVLEGPKGSGKTFLACKYADMLGFSDFAVVPSKVSEIKEAFESFLQVSNNVLLVIENLDEGVAACAYVLLKYMEEPSSNLYVVVTCRSKENVPDTILSRSMTACVGVPTSKDLDAYSFAKHKESYSKIKRSKLWNVVRTFSDADEVCSMTSEQVQYVKQWAYLSAFDGPVSSTSWKLSHYDDGSEANPSVAVKYAMYCNRDNPHAVKCCRTCLDQLNLKRIAPYLTLTKLAFDLKYTE